MSNRELYGSANSKAYAELLDKHAAMVTRNAALTSRCEVLEQHHREKDERLKEYSGWSPHQFLGLLDEHRELGKRHIALDTKRA